MKYSLINIIVVICLYGCFDIATYKLINGNRTHSLKTECGTINIETIDFGQNLITHFYFKGSGSYKIALDSIGEKLNIHGAYLKSDDMVFKEGLITIKNEDTYSLIYRPKNYLIEEVYNLPLGSILLCNNKIVSNETITISNFTTKN